jgi:DMSO/TMAO reductase YedYZ molybdopterin-dependent catalytic subunit
MVRPADVVTSVERRFTSPLHETRTAAVLGVALAVTFGTCFGTGLVSHLIQHPPSWFEWSSRPAGLYRITQGIHVTTGFLSIPILLAKLWTVFPRFWTWPPFRGLAHAVERISLLPLVAGSVFLLFSGVANVARWYPYSFFFPSAHYWAAWLTVGAMIVHAGAKASVTRDALRRGRLADERQASGTERRAFLGGVAATAGLVTLAVVGGTVRPLSRLAALAQRRPDFGPQGLPVNKTASGAGVTALARDPAYRLRVEGRVQQPLALDLDELRALPQHEAELPIACVEGWSRGAHWRGVRVRDLLTLAGAAEGAAVEVQSLQARGRYRRSTLNTAHARDGDTLLALELNGEPLQLDHGYPARVIAPNQPGVLQTKWVSRLVVV